MNEEQIKEYVDKAIERWLLQNFYVFAEHQIKNLISQLTITYDEKIKDQVFTHMTRIKEYLAYDCFLAIKELKESLKTKEQNVP